MLRELAAILSLDRPVSVVDIGASSIDYDRPYDALLAEGMARLVGFEPQTEWFSKLAQNGSQRETYLPYALGDGEGHSLNICRYPGWTSFLKPSGRALEILPAFKPNAEIVETVGMPSKRLDDVAEVEEIDFLKIDVQGAELSIFQNGRRKLQRTLVIQTEVSFMTMYENQPGWGAVDVELRSQGFVPYTIASTKPHGRWQINERSIAGRMQILEADIVYVREEALFESLPADSMKKFALLMHSCVHAYDMAMQIVIGLERRETLSPGSAHSYGNLLLHGQGQANTLS